MTGRSRSLEERLGYQFSDTGLLDLALTHRSAATAHNERLEFLGDAVLDLIIAHELYLRRPRSPEGDLSRARARLVRRETLAQVARELRLGEWLQLGAGELGAGGHQRSSTLADALEAVIGAVYLDGGLVAARSLCLELLASPLDELPEEAALKDPKTRLQEILQSRGLPLPKYEITGSAGAEHERVFHVSCSLMEPELCGSGQGRSRRAAEQEAAASVLEALDGAG